MEASVKSVDKLDELDKRILTQLQNDASLTNQELAARVFASPPTCLRRVRRLEEIGIIQKRVAILDPEKLSTNLTAIVEATLNEQSTQAFDAFKQMVLNESAVLQCYRVSGAADCILIIQVADMPAYHALVGRLLNAHNNVRNVRTFFSIHRDKFDTRVVNVDIY